MYIGNDTKKNKKIIVADDDSAICDALELILKEEGFDVEITLNGQSLYHMDSLPDLILLDISMSGQDGRDICRYLKQNRETRNIPIIMISAGGNIARSAREAGADDYISKPFGIDEILRKVSLHISSRAAGPSHVVSESDEKSCGGCGE